MAISSSAEAEQFAEAFEDLADKLGRAALNERKPQHLSTHAERMAAHAMRTLLAAADAGILRLPFRDPSQAVVQMQSADGSMRAVGRLAPMSETDEGSLLQMWKFFACPWLRALKPEAFPPDAGMRDFPPVMTDAQGRILGPDGQPIRRVFVTKEGTEVSIPEEMSGEEIAGAMGSGEFLSIKTTEAAHAYRGQEFASFDEDDALSYLRAVSDDWAAACRAAASIVRNPPVKSAPRGSPETRVAEGKPPNRVLRRDKVFISYSHRDQKFLRELVTHLKPLERAGRLSVWTDKQLDAGEKWLGEIREALARTRVAVLLVSKDFLASDFIQEEELNPLLQEAVRGGVEICWVLVRACNYKATPLSAYQAVLPPDKPLATMKAERDSAWVRICEEVTRAANKDAPSPSSS